MAPILRVDPIRCDAYGQCAELLPELIELDDWGYPLLADGGVPPSLVPAARRSVSLCPRLALSLVDQVPVQSAADRRGRLAISIIPVAGDSVVRISTVISFDSSIGCNSSMSPIVACVSPRQSRAAAHIISTNAAPGRIASPSTQ